MRVVGLLHQTIGLDADLAAARMDISGAEIGLNFGGNTLLHLDRQQVRAGHTLIAVGRDDAHILGLGLHGNRLPP